MATLPMKVMTDYIIQVGADKVPHSGKTYLAHVIGVYRLMKEWGEDDEMCRAALFHSIYGTEVFQSFTLPVEKRDEVRNLIGDRAEKLAYVNSAMLRTTCYEQVDRIQDQYPIEDRLTGETMALTQQEYEDLIRLHLCDFLEQVERDGTWDYEPEVIRKMGERLGGIAHQTYESVYNKKPQTA